MEAKDESLVSNLEASSDKPVEMVESLPPSLPLPLPELPSTLSEEVGVVQADAPVSEVRVENETLESSPAAKLKEDVSANTSDSHYEDVEMPQSPTKETVTCADQSPVADDQPPTEADQLPVAVDQPPVIADQPSPEADQPPSLDDQPPAEVTSSVSIEVRRDLFANIRYYLINSDREEEVVKLLSEYGAAQDKYLSSFITHVICDRITMADDETELDSEYVEATEVFELKIVKSEWVFKSIYANALLP